MKSLKLKVPALLLYAVVLPASVQAQARVAVDPATAAGNYLRAVRERPGLVLAFLREMPKGGDLHSHLSGAIYAETFIDWAAEAGICVRNRDNVAVAPPCDSASVPIANALRNDDLRGRIIDAWSMRNWTGAIESGHDHFFATFGKFSLANRGKDAAMLVEAVRRAAAGRVSYLELMNTPGDGAFALGSKVGWDPNLQQMREKLKENGLDSVIAAARNEFTEMRARQRELMKCGTDNAEPGCGVEVRFLYQVLRGFAPEQVFTQILTAFEAASVDSLIVGFNMVMPEDGYVSMRDYSLHMRIINYLHGFYPGVRITLHAGELWPGLVPPEGLRFHIREAIQFGQASRIGHGVDVMHEDDAHGLLNEMAERNIAVEINLTSNKGILGVEGRNHPLAIYQASGVPTLLSTDDEGVNRSEMTLEYQRAVLDQGLGYSTLKSMARNSLHYSFIQGESIWSNARTATPVGACKTVRSLSVPDAACAAFLEGSPKARLQWQLERDFIAFESKWASVRPVTN